ncbi:hypothetical protein ON010_g2464 [Phytophthora cinnamomi]|nr:hypothetical protein ON010_g2464 [Phytophthora cinnamomi]
MLQAISYTRTRHRDGQQTGEAGVRANFSVQRNLSESTICHALRFDLRHTRKVLTKRASESAPRVRREYAERLLPYYSGPDQLVFVDKTSKDACWSIPVTAAAPAARMGVSFSGVPGIVLPSSWRTSCVLKGATASLW